MRPLSLEFDDLRPQLLVVKRLEDHVDTTALLRDADAPEPPYWAHLWPGSRALARLLARADCAGRHVIDIGCGLGLAGIVAALRGASVTMLDTTHDGLQFAAASAALNGCEVKLVQTDAGRPGLRGRFDYCLAADVTYDPALQTSVAAFIASHLAPAGRAWCAESVRTLDRGFQRACEEHGLRVSEREVYEFDEGRDVPVRLTAMQWP